MTPLDAYLKSLAPGSRKTMRQALDVMARLMTGGDRLAGDFPWESLTYRQSASAWSVVCDQYAPASARKIRAAVRGVLKAAWRLQLMSAEDRERAGDLDMPRGRSLPPGRFVAEHEIEAMFAACDQQWRGKRERDAAMIGLLYDCGLRRAELVTLKVGDVDAAKLTVRVMGKGRAARLVPVKQWVIDLVEEWVDVRGWRTGRLFTPVRWNGKLLRGKLSGQAVAHVLERLAAQAGIEHVAAHDLRRTFISRAMDVLDLAMVADVAGHQDIQTTRGYNRRGLARVREGLAQLSAPRRRRR